MFDLTFAMAKCSDGGQTWANQPLRGTRQANGFTGLVPVPQGEPGELLPLCFPPSQRPPEAPQILGCSALPLPEVRGAPHCLRWRVVDNPKRCLPGNPELLEVGGNNLLKQGHGTLEI